jgi:adenylosuccinate lyase
MMISPVDGRYAKKCDSLRLYFSEFALIKYRVIVEIRWFLFLSEEPLIKELPKLDKKTAQYLESIIKNFSEKDALRIKTIEKKTNHDVKAVEYFLKEKFNASDALKPHQEFLHFCCTSEDINNIAYALMTQSARDQIFLPIIDELIQRLETKALAYANIPMLARTHGQPASPTALGKEIKNIAMRLSRQKTQIFGVNISAKINGATGDFNAHHVAYPDIDWSRFSREFIESFHLTWDSHTTQIEPHDWIAELSHAMMRFNTVLLDACRDIWTYISLGYFNQKIKESEIGSSTMPHKINPIDFENAEGNLGLANALFDHFANKLPISRLQRDLSDSTVLRNIGVAFSHALLAYQSFEKGFEKLEPNLNAIKNDLENHWELLAEPIQTIMRKYGIENAYEILKSFSRGKTITQKSLHELIDSLSIPKTEKTKLKKLTPENYLGLSTLLAKS